MKSRSSGCGVDGFFGNRPSFPVPGYRSRAHGANLAGAAPPAPGRDMPRGAASEELGNSAESRRVTSRQVQVAGRHIGNTGTLWALAQRSLRPTQRVDPGVCTRTISDEVRTSDAAGVRAHLSIEGGQLESTDCYGGIDGVATDRSRQRSSGKAKRTERYRPCAMLT